MLHIFAQWKPVKSEGPGQPCTRAHWIKWPYMNVTQSTDKENTEKNNLLTLFKQ